MATSKPAFNGDINKYSFSLAGRMVEIAPIDTSLPSTIQPTTDPAALTNFSYLGPTHDGEVNITLNQATEAIATGVIPSDRRVYITGQSGLLEATMWRFEPKLLAQIMGVPDPARTATTSSNRAFQDNFFGGTLGDIVTLLTIEQFDILLVEDAASGGKTFEEIWYYTPRAQKEGDVIPGQRSGKSNVIPARFRLFGYNHASAPGRNILLQQRWIEST